MAFLSKESKEFTDQLFHKNILETYRSTIEDLVEILENRTSLSIKTLVDYYDKQYNSSFFGWRPFIPVASANTVKAHKKWNKFDDPEIDNICENLIIPIETASQNNKKRIKRLIKAQEDKVVETIYDVLDTFSVLKKMGRKKDKTNKYESMITSLIVDHTTLVTIYYIDDSFYDIKKILARIKRYLANLENVKQIRKGTKSKIYQAHNQQLNYSFSYKDNQLLEWEIIYKALYQQLLDYWNTSKEEKKEWLKLSDNENYPEKIDCFIGGTLRGWSTVGNEMLYGGEETSNGSAKQLTQKLVDLYKNNKDIFLGDFISQDHFIMSLPRIIDTLYENILNKDLKAFLLD
ncbi:hypothetical protein SAMN02910357_00087 [Succinivibrio dextrinosolvens]|uniref:hypothetical protein n=1 Tax=Succinivibrio dextrinosolvens TaxID=83771 RepID=UPI0008EF88EC|nr:hypothetical protein [Succinivibrio dextrinosolvens]SFS31985.1 hypothetical protein SAMN02910357_00087 [Succinivibrio dextrinosolvens]